MSAPAFTFSPPIPRRRLADSLFGLAVVLAVLFLAGRLAGPALAPGVQAALELTYHWIHGAAFLLFWIAARAAPGPRLRAAWLLLAGAALTYPVAGLLFWQGEGRFLPSGTLVDDALALLFYPFAALAVDRMGPPRTSPQQTLRTVLDVLLLLTAVGSWGLYLWARGIMLPAAGSDAETFFYYGLLAPAGVFLVLFAAGALVVRTTEGGRLRLGPTLLIPIGILICGLGTVAQYYVTIAGTLTYPVRIAGMTVLMSGAWLGLRFGMRTPGEPPSGRRPIGAYSVLPYLAAATLAIGLLFDMGRVRAGAAGALVLGLLVTVVLVLLRQLMVLRDNQQLARQRLAQETRFRTLIQHVSDALLILSPEGRIRLHSPALARVFDVAPAERHGESMLPLVADEDRDRWERFLAQVALAPQGESRSLTLRAAPGANGEPRVVELLAENWTAQPEIEGIVLAARDVTDRHRLEARLFQAQKMESVGRLAGGIAHDFNNILTAILGYAEGLEATIPAGNPDVDDARQIRRAGLRAAELTAQLLAFARRQTSAPRQVSLTEVLGAMEPMLRRVLGSGVDLVIRVSEDPWPVRADPAQMEQVVLNLAINARDAMPRGGRLEIEARNATAPPAGTVAQELPPGDYAILGVRDTGAGMSPDMLAHVFEPFYTTKPVGKGTGLGLATVYGIVKQSGGHIMVQSTPGRGTTFELYLPRAAGLGESNPGAEV
ncbi:MAG: two-component system sensor histidine kinase NtrB [Gemmatimonadales bacterium]